MTTTLSPPRVVIPTTPGAPASPRVCAVLVVRNGAAWLAENLDGLAGQSRPPERLVVVDLASSDGSLEIASGHEGVRRAVREVVVVPSTVPLPFGEAVRTALDAVGPCGDHPAQQWLWLLHDDSAATPTALARLLEAARRSPSVGVAGPKVVQWEDSRRLVEMGHQLTRSGRRVDAPAFGEADQGQYDTRTDVLAVGTSGMLVRREVFEHLRGFDPAFDQFGADLDFGWRAQLAGFRVIVVPGARVREASATRAGVREGGPDRAGARRAQRHAARRVALARCAPWALPFLALWIAASSVLGALLLLVLKRPQHAWAEVGDLGALARPWIPLGARWRFRRGRRLHRRHLSSLFVGTGAAVGHTWDRIQEALTPERASRRSVAPSSASTESGPVAEEAEDLTVLPASLPQRLATHPGALAVLACLALAAVTFRGALGQGLLDARGAGLAGGELGAVATDSSGLWHLFRDSWHGSGFGTSVPVGPLVGVLAALTWALEWVPYVAEGRSSASVTMAWLLLAAMPLSALTAYLGGRVATPSRWGRALVALAWGSSGVLVAALSQGRLSLVVAHLLLPLVLAGFAAAARARTTFTATFATALATGILGAFVPALLAVTVVAAVLLLVVGPGVARRARALVLAVVPTALLGPWLLRFVEEPRLLLTGPGLLDVGASSAPVWATALGQPDGGAGTGAALFAPVLLAAVLALSRRSGSRARSAALLGLTLAGLVGLALALGAPRVVVGQAIADSGEPAIATLWTGVGLDLYVAALLAIVLTGWHGFAHLLRESRWGWRRILGAVACGIVVLAVATGGALAAGQGLGQLASPGDALPAVAVDQATGPDANRLLVVVPAADRIDIRLVGSEPGELMRDVVRRDRVTDPGLATVVGTIASGAGVLPGGAGAQLADLGVGFVSLHAGPDTPLARSLDAATGLTRLGSTSGQTLWRVLARPSVTGGDVPVQPARVRVVDAQGGPIQSVPVAGPHGAVDQQLPAGPQGRRLVVAEASEWARVSSVSFEGRALTPLSTTGPPTYALPATTGRLVVDLPPQHPRWFAGQLALLALVVFLAVPFGNRRSRRLP